MDEKSQENSLIGEKSDQLLGFSWKNWCKILEARIGGVERRREKTRGG